MARDEVTIPTRDGACPASLFRPAGPGPWPGVLVYMDGIGIRPALFSLCERIDGIKAAAMRKLPAAIRASCQLTR